MREKIKCRLCPKTFDTKRRLQCHKNRTHNKIQYPCYLCDSIFSKPLLLKKHIYKAHNGPKPYQCSFCSSAFTTSWVLNYHNNVNHNINKTYYNNDKCNKSFLCQRSMHQHQRYMHNDEKPHKCQVCSTSF